MKRTIIITAITLAFSTSLFAQAADAPQPEPSPATEHPSPVPISTPPATPTPAQALTPQSAPWIKAALPQWLFGESTTPGINPGVDPSTTVLRSKYEPVVVQQGEYYAIFFRW